MTDEQPLEGFTEPLEAIVVADVIGPPGPSEWRAMREQAEAICSTEFVPKGMNGRPEAVLAAILTGREMGLGPMASLQGIRIENGKPAYDAELMRALVRRRGHTLTVVEKSHARCVLRGRRRDTGETAEVVWTLEDALMAGLIDSIDADGRPVKKSSSGAGMPWQKYPRRMLFARATSELVGDLFADVLVGGSYTPEELAGVEAWEEPAPPEPTEDERKGAAWARIRGAIEAGKVTKDQATEIAARLEADITTLEGAEAVASAVEDMVTTGVVPEPAAEEGPEPSTSPVVAGLREAADKGTEEQAVFLRSIAELIETMGLDEPEVRHVLGHAGRKSVVKALAAADIEELAAAADLLEAELMRRQAARGE
jgi:hypothetical protein